MAIDFKSFRIDKSFRADLEEKTLTPAEKKKREEVAKAIERDNPNMPMGMKMAIATKTAKRVAEDNLGEESLTAGKRLVSKHGEGTHTAKVYKDTEYNEYQVHFYKHGKHMGEGPVSYHDSKDDAQSTANHALKKMNSVKEGTEQVTEVSKNTLKSYAGKAADSYGHNQFSARVSKNPAEKEAAKKTATKRFIGLSRAERRMSEGVDQLQEMDATDRFKDYHNETAKLIKGIHSALSDHYTRNEKSAHWGHVGDIRHVHDQLRDIHDRLHEQGEYAKAAQKRLGEETEQLDEYYTVHPHNENGKARVIGSPTKFMGSAISKTLEHTKKGTPVTVHYKDHLGSVDSVTIKPGEHVKKAIDGLKTQRTNEQAEHYCAKHVYSELFGEGEVLHGDHAEPNESGHVEWYNVQFEHGVEKVFTEDIEIMMAEYHANHNRKKRGRK